MPESSISKTFTLRVALLIRHSLNVSVPRDFQSSVPKQFLNNFWILSIGIQDRAERVTKRVPADMLLQANFVSCSLDVNAIDRLWPIRLRTVLGRACINPIVRPVVSRLHLPKPKRPSPTPNSMELVSVTLRSWVGQFSASQSSDGYRLHFS